MALISVYFHRSRYLPKLNNKNVLRYTVWEYKILTNGGMENSEQKSHTKEHIAYDSIYICYKNNQNKSRLLEWCLPFGGSVAFREYERGLLE